MEKEYGLTLSTTRVRRARTFVTRRVRATGCGTEADYLGFLLSDPRRVRELRLLACAMANHETYFFRESVHFDIFADRLAEIREREGWWAKKHLSVVSAGSSTGEEAYSLAVAIVESGLFLWGGWEVTVEGLDVDPAAVEFARAGRYPSYSLRGAAQERISRWLLREGGDSYRVRDEIRSMVRFSVANLLVPPPLDAVASADVIFCRNVLIYMNTAAVNTVAEHLFRRLKPGGWLIVGHSESLLHRRDLYTPRRERHTLIYEKA